MKILSGSCQVMEVLHARLLPMQQRFTATLQDFTYATPEQFINLPFDIQRLATIMQAAQEKKALQPTLVVLIGIGGSSLGTLAVYEALRQARNCVGNAPRLLCADTIDGQLTSALLAEIEQEWRRGGKVLSIVVSKSGTTMETLINAACCFEITKKHSQNYAQWITIITDYDSPLWKLGKTEKFQLLEVPKSVGGRFSVFSAVGLFPLAVLGIDVEKLLAGARAAVQKEAHIRAASELAACAYRQYERGLHVHDMFTFVPSLYACGQWWRQLVGESLGKERVGREPVGITPTVSLGTNDLHSVAQLYLAGPDERFTLFVACEQQAADVVMPENMFSELARLDKGLSVDRVHQAIFGGVCAAYEQKQRAFMTLVFDEITAYEVGCFLQLQMMSVVYLGVLFEINVFDQPQVELYKQKTRERLRA